MVITGEVSEEGFFCANEAEPCPEHSLFINLSFFRSVLPIS